jgi:hypothetical protein
MTIRIEDVSGRRFAELISLRIRETLTDREVEITQDAMDKSTQVRMVSGEDMIGITGVIPPCLASTEAYLWLYTNPFNTIQSAGVIKATRRVVREFLQSYPYLFGHCEIENVKSHRWLRWLGAEFESPSGPARTFIIKA